MFVKRLDDKISIRLVIKKLIDKVISEPQKIIRTELPNYPTTGKTETEPCIRTVLGVRTVQITQL